MQNAVELAKELLEREGFLTDLCEEREEDFVRACKDGRDDVVAAFLDIGVSVNARQPISHETALIKAAEGGRISTISLLVARGAGLELRDSSDDTAFRTALNWSHPEAARHLASLGADVNAASKYGETCLDKAIAEKPDQIDLLLALKADVNFYAEGRSPMSAALGKYDDELVYKLLDHGASPMARCDLFGTALHTAARNGKTEIVRRFLERGKSIEGFNVDAYDGAGLTALDHALMKGFDEVVELLGTPSEAQRHRQRVWKHLEAKEFSDALAVMAAHHVDVDANDPEHKTPLLVAAEAGDLETVRQLLSRGANPSHTVASNTPLGSAIYEGHIDVIAALFEAGATFFDADGKASGFGGAVWNGRVDVVNAVLARASADDKARLGEYVRSAVMQKNLEMVRALIAGGLPLNHNDDIGGETPLIGAVSSWHHPEIVKALVEGGARLEVADSSNITPLLRMCDHYAWNESCGPTMRYLIEQGARFDVKGAFGNTPYKACKDEQKAIVLDMLVEGPLRRGESIADLVKQHPGRYNWSTLAAFIDAKHPELVPQLIDAGASVDPPKGVAAPTVLNAAVSAGDVDLVKALIARGADVNRAEQYGTTALALAASESSPEMVRVLLAAGADPNWRSQYGSTAADSALKSIETLQILADHGALFDEKSNSTLLSAAHQGNADVVAWLLAHGARVDVRRNYGETPLTYAIEEGHDDVARLLIGAGASPSFASRSDGQTPLTAAAQKGNAKLVRLLVEKGGDLDETNRDGESARALINRRKPLKSALKDLLGGVTVRKAPVEPFAQEFTTTTPEWQAVYVGDATAVLAAIDAGRLDKDAQDPWGTTPLMAAVLHRNLELIQALIERRVAVDKVDKQNAMAWDYVGLGRDTAVDALLQPKMPQSTSMDRLNAQAARSLLAGEFKGALDRGEIKKIIALIKEGKLHTFLGIWGTPVAHHALNDEALADALRDHGLTVPKQSKPKKKATKKASKKKASTKKSSKPAKKTAKKTAKKATKKTPKKTAKTSKKKATPKKKTKANPRRR